MIVEKPSKPTKHDKIMTMTTKNNENRTGIYVQESAGVTTAGDGLAPKGDKSPVANIKESKPCINQSDGTPDSPHHIGQSQAFIIKEEYTSDQKTTAVDSNPITLGNTQHIESSMIKEEDTSDQKTTADNSLGKRKRQCSNSPERNNDGPSTSNVKKIAVQYFTSPAIKAGATEADSSYSREKRKLKSDNIILGFESQKIDGFEVARRKMGLPGRHIKRTKTSPRGQPPAELSYLESVESRKKMRPNTFKHFPFDVKIMDRSHPFMEISLENQPLLLDAVETTVQDVRSAGGNLVKLGPCDYKREMLVVRYMNDATVRFLQEKIPLYNRLWRGADLFLSKEKVFKNRYTIRIRLPTYNLTSEEFLKIIGKQNGLPTECWLLFQKRNILGVFASFGVDVPSYNRLKKAKGYVHFFFDKIQFELNQN